MRLSREVRVLRRMTAVNIAQSAVYRGHLALFMVGNVTVTLTSLLVWRAALASGARLPVGKDYLTTYFVVLSFVTMATSSWMAAFLSEDIRLGKLSAWMIRPASALYEMLANNISEKVLKSAALIPLLGLVWAVFGDSIRVPGDVLRWSLFALSTFFGAVLVFALDVIVGALAFWLDDTAGINRARVLLAEVLSGAVVPLALMPGWSQGFVRVQPYRFTASFPVEIVCGNLSTSDLTFGFALQAGYVVIVCVLARAVWKAGLKAYSAVGA